MKKPIELENIDESKEATCITICFDENTSHYGVLYQAVKGLSDAGFAPEKEIREEWLSLLELDK